MSEKEMDELLDRTCDSLLLAFSPDQPLHGDKEHGFYIPSAANIEESLVNSLLIYLKKNEGRWLYGQPWPTFKSIKKLDKRIWEGLEPLSDKQANHFRFYMSVLMADKFYDTWVYSKGDLYRFMDRDKFLSKFEQFWTDKEKETWGKIHRFMRDYTLKKLEIK